MTATGPEHPAEPDVTAPESWAEYVDHDPSFKKAASLEMSPTLYAKIQWVTNNVPKMSQRKLIMAGAEAEADRLIALRALIWLTGDRRGRLRERRQWQAIPSELKNVESGDNPDYPDLCFALAQLGTRCARP